MKPTKASLRLPLLTFIFSLTLSGCYTQLAFVDDENDAVYGQPPTIIYVPEIVTIVLPPHDPPHPVLHPIPPVGYSPTVTEPQPRPRDTGYQRPSQSEDSRPTGSVSNTRPSGLTRGGR